MPGYDYALSEEAVQAFTAIPPRQRAKLLRHFAALARQPNQQGDYRESGNSGRAYEVMLIDELIVTWWVDHAAAEVRIVRLEFAD